MTAKEFLEQIRKYDELIRAKNEEKRRLIHMATDCSAKLPDGMPHDNTGNTSRSFEDAVIALVALSEEIDKAIAEYKLLRTKVVRTLEKLPRQEYSVLHAYYILHKKWEQIAEEKRKSVRQIYRIRDNGMKILSNVIVCHPQDE